MANFLSKFIAQFKKVTAQDKEAVISFDDAQDQDITSQNPQNSSLFTQVSDDSQSLGLQGVAAAPAAPAAESQGALSQTSAPSNSTQSTQAKDVNYGDFREGIPAHDPGAFDPSHALYHEKESFDAFHDFQTTINESIGTPSDLNVRDDARLEGELESENDDSLVVNAAPEPNGDSSVDPDPDPGPEPEPEPDPPRPNDDFGIFINYIGAPGTGEVRFNENFVLEAFFSDYGETLPRFEVTIAGGDGFFYTANSVDNAALFTVNPNSTVVFRTDLTGLDGLFETSNYEAEIRAIDADGDQVSDISQGLSYTSGSLDIAPAPDPDATPGPDVDPQGNGNGTTGGDLETTLELVDIHQVQGSSAFDPGLVINIFATPSTEVSFFIDGSLVSVVQSDENGDVSFIPPISDSIEFNIRVEIAATNETIDIPVNLVDYYPDIELTLNSDSNPTENPDVAPDPDSNPTENPGSSPDQASELAFIGVTPIPHSTPDNLVLLYTFTAPPLTEVALFIDGTRLGTALSDANGDVSFASPVPDLNERTIRAEIVGSGEINSEQGSIEFQVNLDHFSDPNSIPFIETPFDFPGREIQESQAIPIGTELVILDVNYVFSPPDGEPLVYFLLARALPGETQLVSDGSIVSTIFSEGSPIGEPLNPFYLVVPLSTATSQSLEITNLATGDNYVFTLDNAGAIYEELTTLVDPNINFDTPPDTSADPDVVDPTEEITPEPTPEPTEDPTSNPVSRPTNFNINPDAFDEQSGLDPNVTPDENPEDPDDTATLGIFSSASNQDASSDQGYTLIDSEDHHIFLFDEADFPQDNAEHHYTITSFNEGDQIQLENILGENAADLSGALSARFDGTSTVIEIASQSGDAPNQRIEVEADLTGGFTTSAEIVDHLITTEVIVVS